ncbi:CsbD family protein [Ferrovibrio sp. MS7]|uniref:CsbD family protein n=1 Tax=Ferrovibrio plantarum TaxID=3119164 RepID=UPI003136F54F
MDKNRIVGSAKQARGILKLATGKALGDAKLQVEGKADKAEGQIQNTVGTIKDSFKR